MRCHCLLCSLVSAHTRILQQAALHACVRWSAGIQPHAAADTHHHILSLCRPTCAGTAAVTVVIFLSDIYPDIKQALVSLNCADNMLTIMSIYYANGLTQNSVLKRCALQQQGSDRRLGDDDRQRDIRIARNSDVSITSIELQQQQQGEQFSFTEQTQQPSGMTASSLQPLEDGDLCNCCRHSKAAKVCSSSSSS
jgi:hypothetical protein